MKFAYTIIYVQNVAQVVAFYEQAFGLQQRFVHESGQYAEMETGATTLAFALNELAHSNLPGGFRENDPSQPPAGIEIAFTTEDVPAAYQRAVAAGATGLAEPKTKPWGQVVAYVRDLDGVLIEIGTPM
ncbi:MAG: VOC family protein [Anaerolineae bacterium]|nr:VOC family protein [Anaerolineae bacterium]